jgi:sugar phosphate isomerase/epimerase
VAIRALLPDMGISILREIGYEGTVSLELFNPGLWEKDPAEVLAVGIERMRGLLG